MSAKEAASSKRPLPAPMAGTAIVPKAWRWAWPIALRMELRMLASVAVHPALDDTRDSLREQEPPLYPAFWKPR